jgi:putative NADH-flavin reductase
MDILLIGATGQIGSRVLAEAVSRGHRVTAMARRAGGIAAGPLVEAVPLDARDTPGLVGLMGGKDAVIASLSPRGDDQPQTYLDGIRSVVAAARQAQIAYTLFVGGMSNLFQPDGRRIIDAMLANMPSERIAEPLAVARAREIVEASDIPWTFLCPGGRIGPGERTGHFRLGGEQALFAPGEATSISTEDFAVAAVNELERRERVRQVWHILY